MTGLGRWWSNLIHHRVCYQILFYSVLALGTYLGMRPAPPPTPFEFNMIDSLYHAGGLFVCVILSYKAHPHWRWWFRGLFMFAVGVAVEYVQSFHPTRTADIHDIYANTVGVVTGLLVILVWQRHSSPNKA